MDSKRYDKQIALPEIGISGQQRLADAKVLVIGAGGLGCPVLQNLAAAGVGTIGIVDGDVIDETNLNRQFLYTNEDCGRNKAVVAAAAISKQNPDINTVAFDTFFTAGSAARLVADFQILVDCTDSLESRYLINDVSLAKGIPMVYASIHRFEGQLSVLNYDNGPSYRCLFPQLETVSDSCSDVGVLGVLPNLLGVMQATETLKIILGIGEILSGKLLLYNALTAGFQMLKFERNEAEIQKGIESGRAIINRNKENITAIDAETFLELLKNDRQLIIDLREAYEEPKLDFENIRSIPLGQLEQQLETFDKSRPIVLFCQNGRNSFHAAQYLNRIGFLNISHLAGGIAALENLHYFSHDAR